jgi:hypothetical protein
MRLLTISAAVAVVTILALSSAPRADAVVRYSTVGPVGKAGMPTMYGWWQPLQSTIRFRARTIYRARTAYRRSQTICITWRLYSFAQILNSWVSEFGRNECVTGVRPGWVAKFRPLDVSISGTFYKPYSAEVWVLWAKTGGGALASARYRYNVERDYVCQTTGCEVGTNYLTKRAWISFAP